MEHNINNELRLLNDQFEKQLMAGNTDEAEALYEKMIDLHHELTCYQHEEEMKNQEQYPKCLCGGDVLPLYEEFPSWIQFCKRCDSRTELSEFSSLPY